MNNTCLFDTIMATWTSIMSSRRLKCGKELTHLREVEHGQSTETKPTNGV
jgi:hypothetical protein